MPPPSDRVMVKSPCLLQCRVLSLACFCLAACVAIDTVTINRPLQDSETIVSSGQTFKLGFFSPANTSNRYVGVMYNVPELTVIWVANRDKPLNDSDGSLTISEYGNLVVLNGQKEILWSSNNSNSVINSSAQLLETGNLVLKENFNGRTLWESFHNPTDSFLQSMRVSASANDRMRLTSWKSLSDPSIGNFSAGVEPSPIPQFFIWNNNEPYWRSGPWNGVLFIGIAGSTPDYENKMYLGGDNASAAYFSFRYSDNSSLMYYQLTSTGSILEKHLANGKQKWEENWSSTESQCDVYGKCGPFGSCNPLVSTICTCLQGFQPRDKEEWSRGNWTGGCIRRTSLQCERNNSVGQKEKQDGYVKLSRMKVPDFVELNPASKEDCGNVCLDNCSCIAYAYYTGVGCMHWGGNLLDIQQLSYDGADLYIRVAYSELDNKRDMRAIIASVVVLGLLFIAFSAYFFWKRLARTGKEHEDKLSLFEAQERHQMENIPNNDLKQATLDELPLYSYRILANATDNFHPSNKLGKGGFGQVYKGELLDGQEIAVKRLSKSSGQGIEEFMNEVVVISKLQHRNLVRLLGCCVEREEKMLVYEYMPNRSLDAYLFDSRKQDLLDWSRRTLIIEGIVRGLLYLHRDSRLKIIHRDLKASNILLDEVLNPKISDFGLARIFSGNQDQADTRRLVGTYGYMAPEYAMEGRFSEKSDVYSFGVLLLEIVTGRKNTRFLHDENELSLLGYAWKLWNDNEIVKLIDPAIFDPLIEMEALRYVHVGLLCVQELANDRPNASAVLSMLNSETAELPPPKLPAFTGRQGSSEIQCSKRSSYSANNSISLTIVSGR